jgi:hypothetical protein
MCDLRRAGGIAQVRAGVSSALRVARQVHLIESRSRKDVVDQHREVLEWPAAQGVVLDGHEAIVTVAIAPE